MKTEKELKEEDLGICVTCKKNKATMTFCESSLHFSHGFKQNICESCFKKIQKAYTLWKVAVDERNTEFKHAIEKFDYAKWVMHVIERKTDDFDDVNVNNRFRVELLQKLGLGEEK